MRDSILFSALPGPSGGSIDGWIRPLIEEFSILLRKHDPFFLLAPAAHVKFDNIDLGVVDASGVLFLPNTAGRREYKTTLAGKEQTRIKIAGILSGGGLAKEEAALVCRNGFESIFIPSRERASRYSKEHKCAVVSWENGHYVDVFFRHEDSYRAHTFCNNFIRIRHPRASRRY